MVTILQKLFARSIWGSFLLLLSLGSASAATIVVDGNDVGCDDIGGTPYCTIQPALDAASAGDTIRVDAGTYSENITISKNITLTSTDTSGNTILDGSTPGGIGIHISTGLTNVRITNLTIRDYTTGIHVETGVTGLVVTNNFIDNNTTGITFAGTVSGKLSYNQIINNTTGVDATSATTQNPFTATCNWWGDISGPTSPNNPGGTGDSLSGDIDDHIAIARQDPLVNGTASLWLGFNTDGNNSASGFQLPTMIPTVTPVGDVSLAENNFRVIKNAIKCAQDGQTVTLSGTFDWTDPFAAADRARDDVFERTTPLFNYLIFRIDGLQNFTLTAPSTGDGNQGAIIIGPGDVDTQNSQVVSSNGFLALSDFGPILDVPQPFTGNPNFTLSNIELRNFEHSFLGFLVPLTTLPPFEGGQQIDNAVFRNNRFTVPADKNATQAPNDAGPNSGILFSYGKNVLIEDNIFTLDGTGIGNGNNYSITRGIEVLRVNQLIPPADPAPYDDLIIQNNTITVVGDPVDVSNPPLVEGISENSRLDGSDMSFSGNTFTNTGSSQFNTVGFRMTGHSTPTSTVAYTNNTVSGANAGFQVFQSATVPVDFSGSTDPILISGNTVSNVTIGVQARSGSYIQIGNGNNFTNSGGTGTAVTVAEESTISFSGTNRVDGFDVAIEVTGANAEVTSAPDAILETQNVNTISDFTGGAVEVDSVIPPAPTPSVRRGGGGSSSSSENCTRPELTQITPGKLTVLHTLKRVSFVASKNANEKKFTILLNGVPQENLTVTKLEDGTFSVSSDVSAKNLTGTTHISISAGSTINCIRTVSYTMTVDATAQENTIGEEFQSGDNGTLFGDSENSSSSFIPKNSHDQCLISLENKGVIESAENYKGTQFVKRSEVIKAVVEISGVNILDPQTPPFLDVPLAQWFTSYVHTAKILEWINGYKDGLFRPSSNVSIIEALKIILLAADVELLQDGEVPGIPQSEWFFRYVLTGVQKGITNESSTLNPGRKIRRNEFADMLCISFRDTLGTNK